MRYTCPHISPISVCQGPDHCRPAVFSYYFTALPLRGLQADQKASILGPEPGACGSISDQPPRCFRSRISDFAALMPARLTRGARCPSFWYRPVWSCRGRRRALGTARRNERVISSSCASRGPPTGRVGMGDAPPDQAPHLAAASATAAGAKKGWWRAALAPTGPLSSPVTDARHVMEQLRGMDLCYSGAGCAQPRMQFPLGCKVWMG